MEVFSCPTPGLLHLFSTVTVAAGSVSTLQVGFPDILDIPAWQGCGSINADFDRCGLLHWCCILNGVDWALWAALQ